MALDPGLVQDLCSDLQNKIAMIYVIDHPETSVYELYPSYVTHKICIFLREQLCCESGSTAVATLRSIRSGCFRRIELLNLFLTPLIRSIFGTERRESNEIVCQFDQIRSRSIRKLIKFFSKFKSPAVGCWSPGPSG